MTWPESGHYTVDGARSLVKVFTYKKGLFSAVGHDLEMHTREISGELDVDGDEAELSCRIKLWNLSILESILDGFQKREAESTMRKKVLKKEEQAHADITADVTRDGDDEATLEGQLSLLEGAKTPIDLKAEIVEAAQDGFLAVLSAEFKQSDYGVKPFKGMMGGLKLKDEMRIELKVFWKKA